MTALIEAAVPIADVAKVTGATQRAVEDEARALQLFVGVDWAGRPAVSVVDAAALVSGSARREQEHATAWQAHLRASEAWERDRELARRAGYTEGAERAHSRGLAGPAAASAAREASREAAEKFERHTPAPTFNGEATSPSWFARAASKIKEAAV
ncbi:MAG TPA: hypothetical protein VFP89_02340 [Propionibacteriaceae bacterium]|nr:hypothetical protein [Propionibacteriaceae bacterium]